MRLAKERAAQGGGWPQGPNIWQQSGPPPMSSRGGGAAGPSGGTWVDGRWRQEPPGAWQPSVRYA